MCTMSSRCELGAFQTEHEPVQSVPLLLALGRFEQAFRQLAMLGAEQEQQGEQLETVCRAYTFMASAACFS